MKLKNQHTHKHPITPFQNLKLTKNTMTQTAHIAYPIPSWTWNDYHMKMALLKFTLSNTKYAANFLVTITKQYHYLIQVLQFPACQKHVLTHWILNLH